MEESLKVVLCVKLLWYFFFFFTPATSKDLQLQASNKRQAGTKKSFVSTLWNLFKKAGITDNAVLGMYVWVQQGRQVCSSTRCRQEVVMIFGFLWSDVPTLPVMSNAKYEGTEVGKRSYAQTDKLTALLNSLWIHAVFITISAQCDTITVPQKESFQPQSGTRTQGGKKIELLQLRLEGKTCHGKYRTALFVPLFRYLKTLTAANTFIQTHTQKCMLS